MNLLDLLGRFAFELLNVLYVTYKNCKFTK